MSYVVFSTSDAVFPTWVLGHLLGLIAYALYAIA